MIALSIEGMHVSSLFSSCIENLNQIDMAEQLLTSLWLIACMNFSLKNYSCELFNLTGTVGKVELISTFTTAVCESWNVKPDLHMVVTVAEHACDGASKRILKLSTYPLQIFLVKHQYM